MLTLIEKYEDEHYTIEDSNAKDMLLHFMEAQNIDETDLVQILGSQDIVNYILTDQHKITFEQAMMLGKLFSVAPSLFLTP